MLLTRFVIWLFPIHLVSCIQTNVNVALPDAPHIDTSSIDALPTDSLKSSEYGFIDTSAYNLKLAPEGNYAALKKQVVAYRESVKQQYLNPESDSAKNLLVMEAAEYMLETIINKIIPFWYGTDWDFEGHTSTPNDGKIACGYFVSTTLSHCGFNLNRYKLAQQNPFFEASTVNLADSAMTFHLSAEELQDYFTKNMDEGLYFAGLDFHVGYLLYRNGKLFFIHSSYLSPAEVTIEYAVSSPAFASSKYHIAAITGNDALIKKWILNEEIQVKTK